VSSSPSQQSEQRVAFGARLRRQREARSLTVADVSRTTKIPERSVSLLEAGAFDDLPGEVFVRGFLRSYSRCVGLDAEATLRDYEELRGSSPRPRREPSLVRPGVARPAESQPAAVAAAAGAPAPGASRPGEPTPAPVVAVPPGEAGPSSRPRDEEPKETAEEDSGKASSAAAGAELSIFGALRGVGRGKSRISLTLAVIILVIVATLTLSLLLQGPGRVGDGVSFDLGLR
jgi:hypothetical protein